MNENRGQKGTQGKFLRNFFGNLTAVLFLILKRIGTTNHLAI